MMNIWGSEWEVKKCPKCECTGFDVEYKEWMAFSSDDPPPCLELTCQTCGYNYYEDTKDCKEEDRLWGYVQK